jgi:uncharacterized repeat protein (TIGR01451 family)
MKRFLPFILFAAFAANADAQSISFLLPTVPCHNDGVLVANMTGFTPPLTVNWTTNGTTGTVIMHTVTGLTDALTAYSGGPVSITVSDASNFASASFAGAEPFSYTLTTTDEICPTPGTADVAVFGGSAPYTYQWYDVATSSVVGTGATITQTTGQYGVVITDAAGCTYGSRVNTDFGIIGYTAFTATVTVTPANCTDGTATVSAVDPIAVLPLSYAWSNGATTSSITGLTTGVYDVAITDAAGCVAIGALAGGGSIVVPQTTFISTGVSATPASCTATNGTVSVSAGGGMAPYTYLWSNGVTTQSQTGLGSGSYNVTVTDANGCLAFDNGSVTVATPITVTSSSTPSLCTSPSGNATVHPVGGTGTYAITWFTTPAYTGPTATFLAPGTYFYNVADGAGCEQSGSVTVYPVNIVSASFSSTNAMCTMANGNVTAMPTGGVAPYTYLWSTGTTGATLASVPAGSYSVTITDNMGCKAKVAHNILSSSPVGVGLNATPASCILSNDGSIVATTYGGTAPYSYGWSSGGTTATLTGLPKGSYWLHVTDANGCTASNYTYVGYDATSTDCYCTIQGTIFADTNANCTQEPTEYGMAHVQVFCSGIGYTYTDANGGYSFKVPSGSYTITENAPDFYPMSPCQVNGIPVTTTAGVGCVNTVNFANNPLAVHNLTINTASYTPAVPGQIYTQAITVVNEGTVTEDSVYTTYKTDGQLYIPTFTPSSMFSGFSYHYNTTSGLTTLAPGQSATYFLDYHVPTNMAVGTSVASRDTVSYHNPAGDYLSDNSPMNNVSSFRTSVTNNSNPNFKEVYPKGSGTNGLINSTDSVLTYTVHFKNTGSWFVENVMITDTVDGNLDWTTLHPIYESSPCKVSLSSAGSFKIVTFTFADVNLAPQMFTDRRSDGTFTYSVKLMPGLAVGTQIRNRASIMFDQNEPIITNATMNTLTSTPLAIDNAPAHKTNSFVVYPNPASSSFSAIIDCAAPCTASMTIADITGKTILSKTFAVPAGTQTVRTDVSTFVAGMYFVSVKHNGMVQTQKLTVIR